MMIYDDSKTRAKNRKKIADVARQLFYTKGIEHTTVMDIVREVEMERKTFYNYFTDKEEIADYIYYLTIETLYEEGFTVDDYKGLPSGYEKIKKYYSSIVNQCVTHPQELLYFVHYDYYFRKKPNLAMVREFYRTKGIQNPVELFIEGVEDGTIDIDGEDPSTRFTLIDQSIGSYASRLILREYGDKNGTKEIDFSPLYDLLNIHLKAIKA